MSAQTTLPASATTRQRTAAAVLLLLGVVAYILPTALHGNPPIDDAAATLDYVSSRSLWTLAHFANVAAILMWASAVALLQVSGALPLGRGAVARMSWSIAGGAFAIYFGIHAVGLWSAADQLGTTPEQMVIQRTEALLLVLGSAAFVSQTLVGASVALLGVALMGADEEFTDPRRRRRPRRGRVGDRGSDDQLRDHRPLHRAYVGMDSRPRGCCAQEKDTVDGSHARG